MSTRLGTPPCPRALALSARQKNKAALQKHTDRRRHVCLRRAHAPTEVQRTGLQTTGDTDWLLANGAPAHAAQRCVQLARTVVAAPGPALCSRAGHRCPRFTRSVHTGAQLSFVARPRDERPAQHDQARPWCSGAGSHVCRLLLAVPVARWRLARAAGECRCTSGR